MHGGEIFIRTDKELTGLPPQVDVRVAAAEDLARASSYIKEFAELFEMDFEKLLNSRYYVLKPNTKSPYKQMYTAN